MYELFNPFKRADGTFAPAYATLIEYGVPQYQPDRKIQDVELSADQYNRLIELATDGGKLAERIDALGKDRSIIRLAANDLAAAQTIIAQEVSAAYSMAKEQLLIEDKDLADKIKDVKESQRDVGKYKR
jgi:hypothetical protein